MLPEKRGNSEPVVIGGNNDRLRNNSRFDSCGYASIERRSIGSMRPLRTKCRCKPGRRNRPWRGYVGGRQALVAWISRSSVTRVGLEASGGYERAVVAELRAAGFDVVLFQPRQVRAYAVYRLRRAKTDRIIRLS